MIWDDLRIDDRRMPSTREIFETVGDAASKTWLFKVGESSKWAFLCGGLLKGNGLLKECLPLENALFRVVRAGGGTWMVETSAFSLKTFDGRLGTLKGEDMLRICDMTESRALEIIPPSDEWSLHRLMLRWGSDKPFGLNTNG
jgi:hypothetical protein